MQNFRCPNCNHKISFKEVFKFKKDHQTICENCGSELVPNKTKSWNWGFFIGFLGVIVPAKITLNLYENFFISVLIGIFFGSIAILSVAYYTYKKTEFKNA